MVSDCGGEINGPTGVIDSSNILSDPFSNLVCTWNVTVHPGRSITVKLLTMRLLFDSCTENYVLVCKYLINCCFCRTIFDRYQKSVHKVWHIY